MTLTGLTLSQGLPFESIVEKLNYYGFEFEVEIYPDQNQDRNFFRSSLIILPNKRLIQQAKGVLGAPKDERHSTSPNMNSLHYYASYKVEPNYDLSNLDGRITFDKGRLVELTTLKAFF